MFLDLAKAFDMVYHTKILETLVRIFLKCIRLNLFETYLQNGIHYLKIGFRISDSVITTYGVPQDTALGPILFCFDQHCFAFIYKTTVSATCT